MMRRPLVRGILLGVLLPLAFLLPSFLWGPLAEILRAGRAYFLLPALALMLLPGGFAGAIAARAYPDRRDAWRFATGLLVGGSFVGSLLFAVGTANFVTTLFGGVLLVGFWLWLGALIGIAAGYGRREAAPAAAP